MILKKKLKYGANLDIKFSIKRVEIPIWEELSALDSSQSSVRISGYQYITNGV